MKLLATVLFALPLAAQLQLFSLQSGTPAAIGASTALGSAPVQDATHFRFRVLNTGSAPVALQTITVSGTGFSLASPFTPLTLAPSQSFDFSVRFSPSAEGSFSASLLVNSISTLLRATAVLGPALYLTTGSQTAEVTSSSLQVNVAAGQPLTVALSVGNPHAAPLTLTELSIGGDGFSLQNPPPLPITLAPQETRPIPVVITQPTAGDFSAVLTVGPRRFTIVAVVFRPQLAPPKILGNPAAPVNGQQMKVRLQLAQPASGPGTGTLRATFSGASDDPAILFPNGTREVKFQVAVGSRDATFDGAVETVIQTGTTAGTLRLDATTETGVSTESFRFERGPVVVDTATGRRNGSNLEIDITGFDNTRGAGSLNFRFFDRAGNPVGGVITTTPADQFRDHFNTSGLGGVFRLRAVFPVTGDATIVESALVEIANPVGRTDLQRLVFR